jgi:hypothetical protein
MQLAQYNVATMAFPLDDPQMQGFHELLDPIHSAGDSATGFVWRFKGAEGNYALDVRPTDGDRDVLVAMTVWYTPEDLAAFMKGAHFEAFRRRREWFVRGSGENVCWWVEDGHEPTIEEGEERLKHLQTYGPMFYAFTLHKLFKPIEEIQ